MKKQKTGHQNGQGTDIQGNIPYIFKEVSPVHFQNTAVQPFLYVFVAYKKWQLRFLLTDLVYII